MVKTQLEMGVVAPERSVSWVVEELAWENSEGTSVSKVSLEFVCDFSSIGCDLCFCAENVSVEDLAGEGLFGLCFNDTMAGEGPLVEACASTVAG
jgi:hypothetical protein